MGPKDRPKEPFPAKQRSFKGTGVATVSPWVPWVLSSTSGCASEQRGKAASGDPSGPGPRRWATTAVSSGSERGKGARAAAPVSVSASRQPHSACFSLYPFLSQHKGP